MELLLSKIEPFNVPSVNDQLAAKFMKHISGQEKMSINAMEEPRCWMINQLQYDYPHLSIAEGMLFTLNMDEFLSLRGRYRTLGEVMDRYCVGILRVEIGGMHKGVFLKLKGI